MALAITRRELSAAEVRVEARRSKDSDQARRLLAIALVLEGSSRTEAARVTGIDRQTLRDWVVRYNAEGIDGLRDWARPGRPAQLGPAQLGHVGRLLGRLAFTRLSVRPRHPEADEAARAAFKKTSPPS